MASIETKVGPTIRSAMARQPRPEAERKADAALGKRLTAIRKERGLTQVQLAERLGVPQAIVSRYERGKLRVHPTMLAKLAAVLRVSSDELLGLQAPKLTAKTDDAETRRLWKKFQQVRALPVKDQRAVIRLINSLVAVKKAS